MDPIFSRGLKLLLSSDADAPEQLRNMLDDALRQKYGPSKMISAVMPHKKLKVEEGYSIGVLPMRVRKERGSLDSSGSPTVQSGPGESEESNQSLDDNGDDNDLSINISMLGEDLTCVVCGQMDVGARNQLVECAECHSLYHQDCHQPPLLEVGEPPWYCATCKKVAVNASPVAKPEIKQEKSNPSSGGNSSPVAQFVAAKTVVSTFIIPSKSSSGSSSKTYSSSSSNSSGSSSSKTSSKPSSSSSHKSSSSGSSSKHSSKKSSSPSTSSSSHKHHHKSSSSKVSRS